MAKLTTIDARRILRECDIAMPEDFDSLPRRKVESLCAAADQYRYRHPPNANGSRGRYFHDFLQRVAARSI